MLTLPLAEPASSPARDTKGSFRKASVVLAPQDNRCPLTACLHGCAGLEIMHFIEADNISCHIQIGAGQPAASGGYIWIDCL